MSYPNSIAGIAPGDYYDPGGKMLEEIERLQAENKDLKVKLGLTHLVNLELQENKRILAEFADDIKILMQHDPLVECVAAFEDWLGGEISDSGRLNVGGAALRTARDKLTELKAQYLNAE